ncbi:microcompartment protein [Robertmurraya siralis]|uniref:Microcompartment protein n=1 Tax=Robertmurraya siralis TaxID=77777 RepID=A0A920BT66_9BACI|nr:microcompartment protein [Robertmurraya siralis]
MSMVMRALGLIETVGLAAAIEAADVAVKSANVSLIGYELTKGGGMVTVKFAGDVGAVKAAVEAGVTAAEKVGGVFSKQIIPRVASGVEKMVYSNETVGLGKPNMNGELQNVVEQAEGGTHETDTPKIEVPDEVKTDNAHEEKMIKDENSSSNANANVRLVSISPLNEEETTVKTGADENETEEIDLDVMEKLEEDFNKTSEKEESEVCNICKDPHCPRRKGDLRSLCIHEKK